CLEDAIIFCHLQFLANCPDSLIARKCGTTEAAEASRRAQAVLSAGWPHAADSPALLADLDGWLRADGNCRNPGTTAALGTAALFAALRSGILNVPISVPWHAE